MIKNVGLAAVAIAAAFAVNPACAQDGSGARIGVELGVLDDDFLGTDEVSYGFLAGYDFDLGGAVAGPLVGYTAAFDDEFDTRELSIGGRIGTKLDTASLFYGAVSYSNIDADYVAGSVDGVKFGLGFEKDFGGFYANVETRYGTYDYDLELYQTLVGAGVKF